MVLIDYWQETLHTIKTDKLWTLLGVLVLSRLYGIEAPTFRNPDISVAAALASLGIIVVSGLVAGLLPAWRAVSLKPIEAIREIT